MGTTLHTGDDAPFSITASNKLLDILATSLSAASWLIRFANDMVIDRTEYKARLSRELTITERTSNPDIVATDEAGRIGLILKPLLWESLEENQPARSIELLDVSGGSVVLFIAPGNRAEVLWQELKRRASESGDLPDTSADFYLPIFQAVRLGVSERVMVLTGWHFFLNSLREECQGKNDQRAVAMIDELLSVYELRKDFDEFTPIRPNFLDHRVAQQLIQFEALARDIADAAVESGIAEPAEKAPTRSSFHPMRIGGLNTYLCLNMHLWSRYRDTPLWLRLCGEGWAAPERETQHRLVAAGAAMNSPLTAVSDSGEEDGLWLPIDLACMCERSEVIRLAIEQLAPWGGG